MATTKTIHSMTWELLDGDESGLDETAIQSLTDYLAKVFPNADPEDSYTFEDEGERLDYPVFHIRFDSSWEYEDPMVHEVPVRLPDRQCAEGLTKIINGTVID